MDELVHRGAALTCVGVACLLASLALDGWVAAVVSACGFVMAAVGLVVMGRALRSADVGERDEQ